MMEDAAIAAEERYYGNLSSTVQGKPGGFDNDTGNHKVAELNYSNAARRIGPNALLRVMSGDKVSISVDAFYSSTGQDNSNSSVVADVVASLISAFGGGTSTAMDPTGHYTIGDRNITSFNTTSYPDINNALKRHHWRRSPDLCLVITFFAEMRVADLNINTEKQVFRSGTGP